MGDRHRGPRRAVRNIRKVGRYGTTEWVIALDCGHSERRKRSPKTDQIGCASCVNDERLLVNVLRMPGEEILPSPDDDARVVVSSATIAARVAALLKVPLEMVDVRLSDTPEGLKIQGASVWIPAESLEIL